MSPTNSEPTVHKVYLENLHLENTVHVVLACQAFGDFVSLVFLVSSSVENKQIAQVLVVFLENHLFVIRVSWLPVYTCTSEIEKLHICPKNEYMYLNKEYFSNQVNSVL